MFKFLKKKLKDAVSVFKKKVDDVPEEPVEEKKEEPIKEPEPVKEEPKPEPEPVKVEEKQVEEKKEPEPVKEEKKEEPEQEPVKEEPKPEPEPVKVEEKPVEEKKPEPKPEPEPVKVEEKKEEPEPVKEELKPEPVKEEPKVEEKPEPVKEEPKLEPEPVKKEPEPTKELEFELKEEPKPKKEEPKKEKKGFFSKLKEKVTTKKIDDKDFDKLFWNLELALLENNVAVEVIEKIKSDLKRELVDTPLKRGQVDKIIFSTLKDSVSEILTVEPIDIFARAKDKKPFVICFVGINGSGKTTTIAKMTKLFQDKKLSCVMAAADTFRAAAIDQLQLHADKLGVNLIKHDYGSDAAAVAFDAVKHAEAKNKDIVLIDTAGRIHSNSNLIDEMKKIVRVAKPDLKIFVGESITGNDCVEQAQKFDEAIGIDGIILTKADVDEKGGAALSISYVTKKPILFLGMGQEYKDLAAFDAEAIVKGIGLA